MYCSSEQNSTDLFKTKNINKGGKMDTATYIQEEYILEFWVMIPFTIGIIMACIVDLFEKSQMRMDELTYLKCKRIMQFAYQKLFSEDPKTAKDQAVKLTKEFYKNNLINEKYAILRSRYGKKFFNLAGTGRNVK